MARIDTNYFDSLSFDNFKTTFLLEKNLDNSSRLKLGEISASLSKTNNTIMQKLNRWASDIIARINRYVKKLKKKVNSNIVVRTIPASDNKSGEAAIIVINIDSAELEITIFDSNLISIEMSDEIATVINKGNNRKILTNKDRVADFAIAVIERMANEH